MLEGFWFNFTAGAEWVWVLVEPGGVGGQVVLCRSHLVNSPCHKFPQSHEGVWQEVGGEFIVGGCGVIGGRILEERVSGAGRRAWYVLS